MYDLNTMQNGLSDSLELDTLIDIKDVLVDKNLSREERISEFIRQIKNPYYFKCGKFIVRAKFSDDGISLEDCLKGILL